MQFRTKLGLVDIPNEDVLAAARDIAGSGRGPCESAAPLGALAVASCCLEVSSAEALARDWDAETGRWDAAADKHQANKDWREALLAHAKAETFETCARRLRRQIADAKSRQPQDNTQLSGDGAQPRRSL